MAKRGRRKKEPPVVDNEWAVDELKKIIKSKDASKAEAENDVFEMLCKTIGVNAARQTWKDICAAALA